MNADLNVQPIDVIRAAVETLAAGLGGGEVFSPEQWDRSVATLARCHDQVGGDTRRQLYAVFLRCANLDEDGPRVADQLKALVRMLQAEVALADPAPCTRRRR